jgi:hypothetical protein
MSDFVCGGDKEVADVLDSYAAEILFGEEDLLS